MQNLIEIWYLNYFAFIVPVIVLIVTIFIWYSARSQNIQVKIWLAIGTLSFVLTLPAVWTWYNLEETDQQVLQNYLDGRTEFVNQFGEDVTRALELIANGLGITKQIGIDYESLELFAYLSLAGLVGSIVAIVGYWQSAPRAVSTGATDYLPQTQFLPEFGQDGTSTGAYPPTRPAVDADPVPTTGLPGYTEFAPVDPIAQIQHPVTEQIDVSGSLVAGGFGGQVGHTPQKTELLNAAATVVNAWLVLKEGPRAGKLYHLNPEATTIGRDPTTCEIVLDDTAVSRQHAKVRTGKDTNGEDQYILHDLATANGTRLNGVDIVREFLKDGDEISLGRTVFIFKQIG